MLKKIILLLLLIGILYRLLLTHSGNFIFNIDNARDWVDVREMVELKKIRLIGPTSGIEGFFDGPAWYYLLAIPYIIFGGNPYGAIIMEILLWAIGGYFLLKIAKRWGAVALLLVGSLWVSSNFVVLANLYAFNPNPVIFLMPVFIYMGEQYLKKPSYFKSIIFFLLAGLFFNFEMAYGIFIPPIILLAVLVTGKVNFLKSKHLWIGLGIYFLTLVPQLIFELRHNFFMTKSIFNYLSLNPKHLFNLSLRFEYIKQIYTSVLSGTYMNFKEAVSGFFILLPIATVLSMKKKKLFNDYAIVITLLLILVPFVGQMLLPVNVMSWHLGGFVTASILLVGFSFFYISQINLFTRVLSLVGGATIIIYAFFNLNLLENINPNKKSSDPAVFANQIKAIDYTYINARGEGFKVYTYLPSVIDFPYQYNIWWYGRKKYGYIPNDYAYLPNKPPYIPGKEKLDQFTKHPYTGLIFLIKEPDRIGQRHLWENTFKSYPLIKYTKIGPLDVEVRQEEIQKLN